MTKEKLIQTALDAGASGAISMPAARIALSESFRDLCKANSCGVYGKCWVCPPDCGEIGELMNRVRARACAVLYQTIGALEDSFDFEGMQAAKKRHLRVCQAIQSALIRDDLPNRMHLGAGGCGVCEVCSRVTNEPCRHPERALLSMEACGIDVYNTVKDTPLRYINGQNTVTYFGLVLYDEA